MPERLIVGVAAILSEKEAVSVTTSELETRLSKSVSDRVTVGPVASAIKVVEDAVFKFPARSSNEFSFKVKVTIPE